MAQAPRKRCLKCKTIHRERQCPQCKNQGTAKNKPGDPFYSSTQWRKLRAAKLVDSPLCAECQRQGKTTAGNEVHHLKQRVKFPELSYCWDNLEVLCKSCHSKETAKEKVNA